jgi:hypothetical protein
MVSPLPAVFLAEAFLDPALNLWALRPAPRQQRPFGDFLSQFSDLRGAVGFLDQFSVAKYEFINLTVFPRGVKSHMHVQFFDEILSQEQAT